MADILNQKEQVVKVELTTHGRRMLGLGVYKPMYYHFYDDSIIYDNSYAGIEEETNEIQDRILNNSLSFSALNLIKDINLEPLGNSNPGNDHLPAWSIKLLNGEIKTISESSSYYKKFFSILDKNYILTLETQEKIPYYQEDYILLDLQELNIDDDVKNFEIEIFTFDEMSGNKNANLQRKLYFRQPKNNVIDDIIYDDNELPNNFNDQILSKEDVLYYLDILVDDEIDTEFIVQSEKTIKDKIQGTYSRINDYNNIAGTGPKKPC